MPLRGVPIALLTGCALALAGCGSTTVRHVTTTITRPGVTATTPSSEGETTAGSSTAAGPATTTRPDAKAGVSALAGVSPRRILVMAADALRHAGAYAMRADLVQSHRRTVVDLSATSTDRYEASTTTGQTMFKLIALPDSAYLRGNAAFWRRQAGSSARARAYAGHWLRIPRSGRASLTRSLGTLAPGTLARCLVEDHGTLTVVRRRARVAGRSALIIRDAGNAPGATQSTIAVAATGTPYPLRFVATGRTRSGGRIDVCNNGRGDGATGSIALSQFGDTAPILAPLGAEKGSGAAT